MDENDKKSEISKEIKRLNAIFSHVGPEKKKTVKELIQNAAFCSATLHELQQYIDDNGAVEHYDNGGGQSGTRVSPALQSYSKLISNYNAIIKQLLNLLPKKEQAAAKVSADPMADFLSS